MKYESYIFTAYGLAAAILLTLVVQSILAWKKVARDGGA